MLIRYAFAAIIESEIVISRPQREEKVTDTAALVIYAPFILISLILFLFEVRKRGKQPIDHIFILLSVLLFGWVVLELLYFMLDDVRLIEYVFSAKLAFVAFIPLAFMMMVVSFYRRNRHFTSKKLLLLSLLPAATAVISITPQLHWLLRKTFSVVSLSPLTTVDSSWGIWFYVHLAASQIPMLIIFFLILTQHRKLPAGYRTSAYIMFAAIAVYAVGLVVEMTGSQGKSSVDFNLIGVFIGEFLFFVAVASNRRTDYLEVWQRDIFNYLDESIFIANESGVIADANATGQEMLRTIGVPFQNVSPDKMIEEIMATGEVVRKPFFSDNDYVDGEDFYYLGSELPLIYNMRTQAIPDREGVGNGDYVILSDVTRNRLLIERLRDIAGKDVLTGLGNRYRYQQLLRELDRPDMLPLSIIIGDVNGLKAVNDRGGHAKGDALLTAVAEILQKCCPKNGFVTRIGGDEFAMLLPKHSNRDMAGVIESINAELQQPQNTELSISIALGGATKVTEDQNMNSLISAADATMYAHKK